MKSLAIFLENYSPSSIIGLNSVCLYNNFENQVLEWLFSRINDDNSPFQVVSDDKDLSTYEIFAYVAALLCLQNNDCGAELDMSFTSTGL